MTAVPMNILKVVSSIGNARMVSLCHGAAPGTYNTTSLKESVFPTQQKSVPLQIAIQHQVFYARIKKIRSGGGGVLKTVLSYQSISQRAVQNSLDKQLINTGTHPSVEKQLDPSRVQLLLDGWVGTSVCKDT